MFCKMLEEGSNEEDALESLDASPQRVGQPLLQRRRRLRKHLVTEWCYGLFLFLLLLIKKRRREFIKFKEEEKKSIRDQEREEEKEI